MIKAKKTERKKKKNRNEEIPLIRSEVTKHDSEGMSSKYDWAF